jgi:hypothetical protein
MKKIMKKKAINSALHLLNPSPSDDFSTKMTASASSIQRYQFLSATPNIHPTAIDFVFYTLNVKKKWKKMDGGKKSK